VQILNRPENTPRRLQLPDFSIDSSSGDDSSGNDDLALEEIRKRHQVVRRRRTRGYTRRKRERWERARRIRSQQRVKDRRGGHNIIIMEYVRNGTLESLVHKLVVHRNSYNTRIPNRILWGFVSNFQVSVLFEFRLDDKQENLFGVSMSQHYL
jgi:hypothetical protein